jgi:phenylpropionate dioxygenase-like ring-hydroxylating dioxygenase large terminal subunit
MNQPFRPPGSGQDPIRADYIPASDYVSEDILRLEKTRLWPRVWQIACRREEIPNVGDFVNYEIFDESILVVRTGAEEFRAFYNVCQHRGRRLRDEARGHLSGFFCRFHGWKYDLEGKVTYIHNPEDWANCPTFKQEDLSLRQVKVDTWGGWVWINQDPNAEPLRAWLGEVADALDPYGLEDCRRLFWKTIIAPVNWKVVIEAFDEGYHSFATHNSGINYRLVKSPGRAAGRHGMFWSDASGFGEYRPGGVGEWKEPKSLQEYLHVNNVWQHETLFALTLDPSRAASERLVAEYGQETDPGAIMTKYNDLIREETEKRGAKWPKALTLEAMAKGGTDWHMFPNTICLPSQDGALWYRLRPNGDDPDSCVFDIWSLGRYAPGAEPKVEQEVSQGFEAFKGQCFFLEEDFANMVAVHKGMKSAGWTAARTNPLQEGQIVNFHRTLREFLGIASG